MKTIFTLILLSVCLALQCQTWDLVWSDEFDGNSLDDTKWTHDQGTGSAQGLWGWGNGELQYYQEENTSVANGELTIEAREEPQGISDFYSGNVPYYYSSSKITTKNKFEFIYGKVEARIKTIDGQGYWPAFWMLPGEGCWPLTGEIDIMEQWGNDGNTTVTTGAAHLGNCGESSTYQVGTESISNGSYADDFHVYSVIWYEDYIGWYVDDQLFHSVIPSSYPEELNWPFNGNDWYLIINLAITNSGPNGNTMFPNSIDVDYVRVYQTNDIIGCTDPVASNYDSEATMDDSTCIYPVTFNVNMNCSSQNPQTVFITGPFTTWCGNCFPLSDPESDGIWTGTYDFPQGTLEYKYEIDNWSHQENLIDDMQNGASCAPVTDYQNYANRLITVDSALSVFDSYGSCSPCAEDVLGCTNPEADNFNPSANIDDGSCIISGCTDSTAENFQPEANNPNGSCYFNVSFSVNMNEVSFSFDIPEVNGTWNGWCGACNQLSDFDSDNIWEGSFIIQEGFQEFKFAVDNWANQEELAGQNECTLTTGEFTNRTINITGNQSYPLVCWESCENCLNMGCTDPNFTEYDPYVEFENGSCMTPVVLGCTYVDAENFNPLANTEDYSCVFGIDSCPGDFNSDGLITAADLTGFLAVFGGFCE